MIHPNLADNGKILYSASAPDCIPFLNAGDNELVAVNSRNFEICRSLEFSGLRCATYTGNRAGVQLGNNGEIRTIGIPYAATEVNNCGVTVKIISFIEDDATIQILKHCGKWKKP